MAATPQQPPASTGLAPSTPGQPSLPIDPTQGTPTGSSNNSVPIPPLQPPATDQTTLKAGEVLPADGLKNGDYSLRMMDGNLVLSGPDGRVWESATDRANAFMVFRTDGSLQIDVSSSSSGYSIWSKNLQLSNVGSLQLTDKGRLVVLDKNGKELAAVAEPSGIKHLAVVILFVPLGSPWWLESLVKAIEAWFQKAYDTLGAGKPAEIENLFKMLTNQGLLDPRKEKNTGKLVEQYAKKGDYIEGVKKQLQQGNAQIQLLSLSQIPEKIAETRIKLDRIVDELNDKLRQVDPDTTVGDKELKPAAAEAAVDALYQAVGRAEKVLKAASDFIAEKQKDVADNLPGTNQVGASGNGTSLPPLTGIDSIAPPGQDMAPLFADLLGEHNPAGEQTPGGVDIDALIKDLGGEPGTEPVGNGGAPAQTAAPTPASNPLAGMMGMLPMLPMLAQMMNQMRPQPPERRRPVEPEDPNAPSPADPGAESAPAPSPVTYTDAPGTVAPTTAPAPPSPPTGRKSWVDMKVENVQQKVPEAVARAVNKEFNDPNGIDARDAYAGTSGQSTEDKPWAQVDSSNVKTGDVVQWTNTTTGATLSGIVVVNGADMQLVTHDKLIALDLNNPPASGSGPYEFVGFFHPSGVDGDAAPDATPPTPPAINAVAPPVPAPPTAPITPPRPRV
ncbi:hypothetical protein [Nocardia brasiliensis]|uniref:hypothetical protein n=1 Tax=Nocardia brasiliensis TaxID=37326 RepID=UPI0024563845|nr:hypothetical protein [Nocardia brasiliensis]